jgi:uncharacterized phage protein gp47/JayE
VPWLTPTLKEVRSLVRDNIRASLPGADASVPNSVLRVLSDAQGGLSHLTLQYIDWLALQLLPDTAETEWLDRHGQIWLVNADGTLGRKQATFASGSATFTGTTGTVIPLATQLEGLVGYETTLEITIGTGPTEAPIRALDPGIIGNLESGSALGLTTVIPGADGGATVVELDGGVDTENDDDLRARILFRIRHPPMGGDADDYVAWTLSIPGVTRAWAATEMGIGTVTVRFMMDELRADQDGFPNGGDIIMVEKYLDTVRPVAIKDFFVESPVPEPIYLTIRSLVDDTESAREEIVISIEDMLRARAAPAHSVNGQMVPGTTIYAAWISEAISEVTGVISFTLDMDDHPMPYNGSLAVLGTIIYER